MLARLHRTPATSALVRSSSSRLCVRHHAAVCWHVQQARQTKPAACFMDACLTVLEHFGFLLLSPCLHTCTALQAAWDPFSVVLYYPSTLQCTELKLKLNMMNSLCLTYRVSFLCSGTLLFTEFILFGFVEGKRWADLKNPGSQGDGSFLGLTDSLKPKENGYPGGWVGDSTYSVDNSMPG